MKFNTECVWVSIKINNHKLAVASIYRPPSANCNYFDELIFDIEKVASKGFNLILLGDFNFNILYENNEWNKRVSLLEQEFDLKQLITTPTQVIPTSKTLIDLIFTSSCIDCLESGVLDITLSDHYATFASLNLTKPKLPGRTVKCRNFNSFSYNDFISDLISCETLSNYLQTEDTEVAWSAWKTEFIRICNIHAPFREIRVKSRFNPWFSSDILQLIQEHDKIHKLAHINHDPILFQTYKSLRNKVTSKIRNSKRNYYTNSVSENKECPKSLWKILSHLLPNKRAKCVNSSLDSNDFNNFFSSVGERLTQHFDELKLPVLNFNTEHTFEFIEININDILQELLRLPNRNKSDILNFDSSLLRLASPIIAPMLCHIFNLSLYSGVVPSDWKLAKVTPIYKGKGDLSDPGNFRPISVVSTVAKLMEK